jgi:hypothetical protein
MYTAKNLPEQPLSCLGLMPSPSPQALCKENLEMIQGAILSCTQTCNHLKQSSFTPTRLLDIGTRTSDLPRLVITAQLDNLEPLKYAALSYCWGNADDAKSQLQTTNSSLEDRCAGIPTTMMTRILYDAVQAAQALSIQYLWIDSLCIIQDDINDWNKQSSQMGYIFRHAYITFCSLASSSCHDSLFDRTPSLAIDFQSNLLPTISGSYTIHTMPLTSNLSARDHDQILSADFFNSKWLNRGWTFQEDCLSTRRLLFGTSSVHFSCGNIQWSEGQQSFGTEDLYTRPHDVLNDLASFYEGGTTLEAVYEIWMELVSDFTARQLTYSSDKFPAIAGVAQYVSETLKDTYLAGLWKENLLPGILWHRYKNDTLASLERYVLALHYPDPYIAPSWSWATDDIYVNFYIRHRKIEPECTIISANIETDMLNPFGQVQQGKIVLEGKIMPLAPHLKLFSSGSNYNNEILDNDGQTVGNVYLDWKLQNVEEGLGMLQLFLICSMIQSNNSHIAPQYTSMAGLVIHPAIIYGEFYRVGIFNTRYIQDLELRQGMPKLFDSCKIATMSLI